METKMKPMEYNVLPAFMRRTDKGVCYVRKANPNGGFIWSKVIFTK